MAEKNGDTMTFEVAEDELGPIDAPEFRDIAAKLLDRALTLCKSASN